MRVAYVNSVAGYGSTGRLTDQLAGMQNVEGKIYFGRKKNLSDRQTFRMTSFAGNVNHGIQTFILDRQALANTKETERMIEDLDRFHPDLIHLHNLHGYYIDVRTLFHYLQKTDIPVIWTLHDCWSFTGHCAHYEAVGCSKWKTECDHCPQLWPYYPTFYGGNVKRNYNIKKSLFTSLGGRLHLTVPSQWLKDQVSESFLKDTECTVIPNGIDLSVFHPMESSFREKYQLEGKYLITACSSTWTKRKGFDQLADLSYRMPDNSVLCVIGVSKKQAHQLSEDTIAVERTDSVRQLAEIYSASDLFINPTQEESFSLVNVESQACGCPVCTYRAGGSTEMVTDQTGVVLIKNDLDGMRKTIEDITLGKRAFQKKDCVENAGRFSRDNMFQGYMNLYQRLMERNV